MARLLTHRFTRLPVAAQRACVGLAGILVLFVAADLLWTQWLSQPVAPEPARVATLRLDARQLRDLTENATGPLRINRLRVATNDALSFNAFQLVYSDRRQNSTVLMDTGPDERSRHAVLNRARFDPEALSRVQREIDRARAIYALRSDSLHLGGFARSERAYSARDRLRLNLAQLRSPALVAARFPPTVLEAMRAMDCPEQCVIEPGVVRITRGRPDTAWIYLRLADGQELLLVHNPALAFAHDIEQARPRSWFYFWRLGLDGREITAQAAALRELHAQSPRLRIVPVHDEAQLQALERVGLLHNTFESVSPFAGER